MPDTDVKAAELRAEAMLLRERISATEPKIRAWRQHAEANERKAKALEAGRPAGPDEWVWSGIVRDAGGGVVTIVIDRDEESYPVPGARVRAITTEGPRSSNER